MEVTGNKHWHVSAVTGSFQTACPKVVSKDSHYAHNTGSGCNRCAIILFIACLVQSSYCQVLFTGSCDGKSD